MLTEARRRIRADSQLASLSNDKLDLVRLGVGNIPMKDNSVDALHAGAAMHCWPDLDSAISEIHRVLKPGGRYFATTFLAGWFRAVGAESGQTAANQQAFQLFDSTDTLRDLLERNGFESSKVSIEVVGPACVVIRCEK